jgi:hypothetical protein
VLSRPRSGRAARTLTAVSLESKFKVGLKENRILERCNPLARVGHLPAKAAPVGGFGPVLRLQSMIDGLNGVLSATLSDGVRWT